jgi:hypothetical protein
MPEQSDTLTISIVVPVYSGAPYLGKLITGIADLRSRWEGLGLNLCITEAIFVLDGPIDQSAAF